MLKEDTGGHHGDLETVSTPSHRLSLHQGPGPAFLPTSPPSKPPFSQHPASHTLLAHLRDMPSSSLPPEPLLCLEHPSCRPPAGWLLPLMQVTVHFHLLWEPPSDLST